MGSSLCVSLVSLLLLASVSALSPHRFGCRAFKEGGAPAAAHTKSIQLQGLHCLREGPLAERIRGPPYSPQKAFGVAFLGAQPGLERRSQRQKSRSPLLSHVHGSWACSTARPRRRLGPLLATEGPLIASKEEEVEEAGDFESWGHHSLPESSSTESREHIPLRELGAPRVPGAIDVHFGSPSAAPLGGPQESGRNWEHLQLPLETFLFLALDAPGDALRFLKDGGPHLLRNAHIFSGGPQKGGAQGADVYELRLAHASFIEAAAAAVQRRAAAQSEAPKGTGAFASLRKQIDQFFEALYPRVGGPRPQQQQALQQQQQGQSTLLQKVAETWGEFRGALFLPEELPPFEEVPVAITKGGAPLWEVRRATGAGGPDRGPGLSRKLLLRLPEVAFHEALLQSPPTPPGDVSGEATTRAADATAARSGAALRWAVLSAMVRYRELLDPQALDLTADPQSHREGPQGPPLSIREPSVSCLKYLSNHPGAPTAFAMPPRHGAGHFS